MPLKTACICVWYQGFGIKARSTIMVEMNRKESDKSAIVRIDCRPTLRTVGRAVKADEISVVEPTQPLRLARQSKNN